MAAGDAGGEVQIMRTLMIRSKWLTNFPATLKCVALCMAFLKHKQCTDYTCTLVHSQSSISDLKKASQLAKQPKQHTDVHICTHSRTVCHW